MPQSAEDGDEKLRSPLMQLLVVFEDDGFAYFRCVFENDGEFFKSLEDGLSVDGGLLHGREDDLEATADDIGQTECIAWE